MVLHRLFDLLDRGEWVQVKREAEQLMLLPDLDYYHLGRIYQAGGRACIGLSEFHAAVKLLELGLPYALKARDWDSLGFMRHYLGACHMVLGYPTEAGDYLQAYLLDLPRYDEARRMEGRAHYNLGLLYRQRKEYGLAVAAYRQALYCFVEKGEVRNAADCHQNMAWMLLVQGKADEARIHIDLAGGFLEKLPDDFRTEQLIVLALYHTVMAEPKTAREYLSPILEGRVVASEAHLGSARWVEAKLLAAEGSHDRAKAVLEMAIQHSLLARAAHLINLCQSLKEEIPHQLG